MSRVTYQEAETYISELPKFTKKNTLEHTQKFLSFLGNPQNGKKVIHVAGTNGKGSVCVYLDAMLRAQRKHTGLFTSPHLIRMNERIRMDGEPVSDETFTRLFLRTQQSVRRMEAEGLPHPSFFEFLFGMAMAGFEEAGVEYVILETGLGGRLDATNSISGPLTCILTSIGLDHTEILGNTLEEIAAEKAGILKPHVPVIFADTQQESSRVIEERAGELGCPCKKIGKSAYEILKIQDGTLAFSPSNAYYGDTTWKLQNTAMYQPENAMLAMEAMRMIFGEQGDVSGWREALSQVKWEGRMEEILPDFYVDGAHNVSAVRMFVQSIQRDRREKVVLFSAVREKNYEEMIHTICSQTTPSAVVVTEIKGDRIVPAGELSEVFAKYTDAQIVTEPDIEKAFERACTLRQDGLLFCAGSLYLVGEIKEILENDKFNSSISSSVGRCHLQSGSDGYHRYSQRADER